MDEARERLQEIIGRIVAELEQLPEVEGKAAMMAGLEELRRIAETIGEAP